MNHMEDNVARQTANNANGMATAAFLFALIAAVFAALTYFMLPSLVQKGMNSLRKFIRTTLQYLVSR